MNKNTIKEIAKIYPTKSPNTIEQTPQSCINKIHIILKMNGKKFKITGIINLLLLVK